MFKSNILSTLLEQKTAPRKAKITSGEADAAITAGALADVPPPKVNPEDLEEFDLNEVEIIGSSKEDDGTDGKGSSRGDDEPGPKKKGKRKPSDGNGGEDEDEDEDEDIDEEIERKINRNAGDDHRAHHDDEEEPEKEPTPEEIEEHNKKVSRKVAQSKSNEGEPDKGTRGASNDKAIRGAGGREPRRDPSASKIDYSSIRPRFRWKELLERLVKSSETTEITYQRPHRRNISGIHAAAQIGAGVIKPGEKVSEANLSKLVIVVDSSGSMSDTIKRVMAELQAMFRSSQNQVARSFVFVEFSGSHKMYMATLDGTDGRAIRISGPKDVKNPSGAAISVNDLLTRHVGGSTNFGAALTNDLRPFLAQKYNVIVMTDSDILMDGNWEEFIKLYAEHPRQVSLIVDSSSTFSQVAQKAKGVSGNFSHF